MSYDCVIIGGGPAGMNAALVLGRARKNVIVIDEGHPRNRVTHEAHGFLTRDRIHPSELKRIAKEQISLYPSVSFTEDTATAISGTNGQFHIKTSQGQTYQSKKVLFAVGMKDFPLDIPGLTEVYGSSAFVCPYCDGWELQDQHLVLIYKGADALHMAKIISGWTKQFTICTNGPDEMTEPQREELKQHQIPVYDSPIQSIQSKGGIVQQILLDDGTPISCRGIFFRPKLTIGSDLPQAIGCQMTESGTIDVDLFGKTSVPGVFSAGDSVTHFHQAITAASLGSIAAAAINNELNEEAWTKQISL
ncbi:NAD(P)/FAD-dependent oxidoreductase [Marinicrinis lubricantis]|uniref:NAD(P)/FAD-dependent oxidoreductase n=1 Tax=Marinicrinis lubricantis TaxID=2086470 RepID=A0ABW1IKR9_9BACL